MQHQNGQGELKLFEDMLGLTSDCAWVTLVVATCGHYRHDMFWDVLSLGKTQSAQKGLKGRNRSQHFVFWVSASRDAVETCWDGRVEHKRNAPLLQDADSDFDARMSRLGNFQGFCVSEALISVDHRSSASMMSAATSSTGQAGGRKFQIWNAYSLSL